MEDATADDLTNDDEATEEDEDDSSEYGGCPLILKVVALFFVVVYVNRYTRVDRYKQKQDGQDLDLIEWYIPVAFSDRRHREAIVAPERSGDTWRVASKDRMKTVSVALLLCLNVGVDPPDVDKPQPCARLECWIDPLSNDPLALEEGTYKPIERIGLELEKQYKRWQQRARYKQCLDPTSDDVKKLVQNLRRSAKEERVLFHYNGHGVPKPTTNGEIWVFNKQYTQYIPLSIYDLATWIGLPSVYVFDCHNAGVISDCFLTFLNNCDSEWEEFRSQISGVGVQTSGASGPGDSPRPFCPLTVRELKDSTVFLCACSPKQELPMNAELPADLFTSCLTTPIKIALRWFLMEHRDRHPDITTEMLDKIPGHMQDRRTMLGELNWILTAITDTIAWNTLPRELFQKLFRQDLLLACLFRNFLLAQRIMQRYNCTPVSHPRLPVPTADHPMWDAWDMVVDECFYQLPSALVGGQSGGQFAHSTFFSDQLTAFQVWLSCGVRGRRPPEQLPVVLQVLLSHNHRLRALDLLGRFCDLGPWAVNQALSVGIFPYVLKLLQATGRELRPYLVFIWAKIMAVDFSVQ